MGKPRILAVDDQPANLMALNAVLKSHYELIEARSGQEAVTILTRDPNVDVILMDIQMPGMDGYQTAARIKKLAGCEDIPLVFITAIYHEDPEIKRGYEAGAVDYFTKPFDPDILRMKLEVYASFRQRATMLKARERQLRESEDVLRAGRKLASVLEALPAGVMIADARGRICQTNEHVLRIFKSTHAVQTDAYGEILSWWARDDASIKQSRLAMALDGHATHNEVVTVKCLDGLTKKLLMSTSPLRGLDGSVVGAVIVMQDMTEHHQVEADFEQRVARLLSMGIAMEQRAPE